MDKLVALYTAIKRAKNEDAKALINELGVEAKYSGGTPLNYSVIFGNKEIFDYLISRNADVNALYEGGYSNLMAAAENRDEYMAKVLMENRIRIDFIDNKNNSALSYAVLKNRKNLEFIKVFLDYGAYPSDDVISFAKEVNNEKLIQLLEQYRSTSQNTSEEKPSEIEAPPNGSDKNEVLKYIWNTMVPRRGPAATIQGELLSSIEKIRWECADNGGANWGPRFIKRGEFIRTTLLDSGIFAEGAKEEISAAVDTILAANGGYFDDDMYDLLGSFVADFYLRFREPIPFNPPEDYV